MKSYNFLFWAYNVIWAGLALWILMVFNRIRRVDGRLDAMEAELQRREGQRSVDS